MIKNSLDFDYSDKTIQEFVLLFNNGQLNLEPGFQRDSVWTLSDRKKLIESLFQKIKKREYEHCLMGYKIQTVEITGELADIIDLFVRINSTGKRLTGAEKRHAKFFRSDFLKQAGRLSEKKRHFFLENKILSAGQISRMKHVELICELMTSILAKGLINKKKALDGIIGGQSPSQKTLHETVQETIRILNLIKRMFPDIRTTRFANSADFYSLFVFIWEMDRQGCILTDSKRNKQAQKLLIWLSNGVATVRQQVRKAEGASQEQRLFADYLLTVQGDTDSLATRQRRAEILKKVFGGLFEKKDEQRGFTVEQRQLIWHSDERRLCAKCRKPLSWSNFTIDHIKPHALGGRSTLSNAVLMCRQCNSRKGKKK